MVRFWVRSELFEFGLLPFPQSSVFLTFDTLAKIARRFYAKQQAKQALPLIKISHWIKTAQKHLGLNERQATSYFHLFQIIVGKDQNTTGAELLNLTKEEKNDLVNFYQFLVFLFLHRIFLFSSSSTSEQPTPSIRAKLDMNSTQAFGSQQPSPTYTRLIDPQFHMEFVKNHLSEILFLIAPSNCQDILASPVTRMQFDELSFLFAGGVTFKSKSTQLNLSTPFWQHVPANQTYTINEVKEWIRSHLTVNSFCYTPLSVMNQEAPSVNYSLNDFNFHYDTLEPLQSPVVISKSFNQTIVRTDAEVGIQQTHTVRLSQCRKSNIYLLSRMELVSVIGCSDCIVLAGVVDKALSLQNCERVTVITASKSIQINSCIDCKLYVSCSTFPVLVGSNNNIQFAPYNTFYSQLESHLSQSSMKIALAANLWNHPVVLSAFDKEHCPFSLMVPNEYANFVVPFEAKDFKGEKTKVNPFELPFEYKKALKDKQDCVTFLQEAIKSMNLDEASVKKLRTLLDAKFYEWLKESGNMRQILQLLRYEGPNLTMNEIVH